MLLLFVCAISCLFLGLLDPRWREQKNKEIEEKREQEEVFAAGQFMNLIILLCTVLELLVIYYNDILLKL